MIEKSIMVSPKTQNTKYQEAICLYATTRMTYTNCRPLPRLAAGFEPVSSFLPQIASVAELRTNKENNNNNLKTSEYD